MSAWKDAYGNQIPKMSTQEATRFAEHVAAAMRKMNHVPPERFIAIHMNALIKVVHLYGIGQDNSREMRKREAYRMALRKANTLLMPPKSKQMGRQRLRSGEAYTYDLAYNREPDAVRKSPIVIWPILAIGAELMGLTGVRRGGDTSLLHCDAKVREAARKGSGELTNKINQIRESFGQKRLLRDYTLSWLADTSRSWTPIDCWRRFPAPRARAGAEAGSGWEMTAQSYQAEILEQTSVYGRDKANATATLRAQWEAGNNGDKKGNLDRAKRRSRAKTK